LVVTHFVLNKDKTLVDRPEQNSLLLVCHPLRREKADITLATQPHIKEKNSETSCRNTYMNFNERTVRKYE